MELNYEAIMDYYRCPMLYHFKHQLNLKRDKELELYKSCLHKVIMFFYYQILDGNIPSIDIMRNKWYKMWNKDGTTIEDIIFKNTNARLYNYNLDGLTLLEKFYYEETDKQFTPIVVDTDVRVPIGDHYVLGTLELVREFISEEGKSVIELTRFINSRYKSEDFLVKHDFKLTFQAYAFRKLFNVKEDRLTLHNVKTGLIYSTYREEEEFNRLKTIVTNVGDAIEEGKFHPIVTFQCKSCLYQDVCDKYKF